MLNKAKAGVLLAVIVVIDSDAHQDSIAISQTSPLLRSSLHLYSSFIKGGFYKIQFDFYGIFVCFIADDSMNQSTHALPFRSLPSKPQSSIDNETSQSKLKQRLLGALLGEEDGMDVGENSTGGDGDSSEKLVELLIVLDGKSDVSGDDARLLVVPGGVSSELKDLSAEVLKDGGEVDPGSDSSPLGVSSLPQVSSDTGDGELKSSFGRRANALSGSAASLSLSSGDSLSFSFSCWVRVGG